MFYCANDNTEMEFDHTNYYDFDEYVCPKCGERIFISQEAYLDDESLMALYGADYFDDAQDEW